MAARRCFRYDTIRSFTLRCERSEPRKVCFNAPALSCWDASRAASRPPQQEGCWENDAMRKVEMEQTMNKKSSNAQFQPLDSGLVPRFAGLPTFMRLPI